MKSILRAICYVILGLVVAVVAANQFIRVTGGSHGEDQGIVTFFLSEKIFVKKATTGQHYQLEDRQSRDNMKKAHGAGVLPHMTLSYEAVRKVEAIFAEKTPDTFNSSDLKNVITALEQALAHAELVSNADLDRIHPQMRAEFRQKYQTALGKMANGFKYRDQNSAIDGYELYQKYRAWALSHQQEFSFRTE